LKGSIPVSRLRERDGLVIGGGFGESREASLARERGRGRLSGRHGPAEVAAGFEGSYEIVDAVHLEGPRVRARAEGCIVGSERNRLGEAAGKLVDGCPVG